MEDLERKFKKEFGKKAGERMFEGVRNAELRVTPGTVEIKGSKPAILALLSSLVANMAYETEGNFTREEVEYAIEVGLMPNEEKRKKASEKKEKFKKLIKENSLEDEEDEDEEFNIDEAIDELKGLLDQLKNIDKED